MDQTDRPMVAGTPQGRYKMACTCGAESVSEEVVALTNTLRELAAIRSTAEDAATRILDSAEGLLAMAGKNEAEKAEEAILSIMTACGFHDIVGQRVTKITETLDQVIAASHGEVAAKARKPNASNSVSAKSEPGIALEGPALPGASKDRAQDQAGVDALFSDKR